MTGLLADRNRLLVAVNLALLAVALVLVVANAVHALRRGGRSEPAVAPVVRETPQPQPPPRGAGPQIHWGGVKR